MNRQGFPMALLLVLGIILITSGCAAFTPPPGGQVSNSGDIFFPDTEQKFAVRTVRDYDNKGLSQAVQYIFEKDITTGRWKLINAASAAQQGLYKTIGEQILPASADMFKSFILGPFAATLMPQTRINFSGGTFSGGNQFQLQGQNTNVKQNQFQALFGNSPVLHTMPIGQ